MPFSNLAPWDRALRLVVGAVALSIGWTMSQTDIVALALRVLGWVPVLTGLLGWSPLYSLLGFTTRAGGSRDP